MKVSLMCLFTTGLFAGVLFMDVPQSASAEASPAFTETPSLGSETPNQDRLRSQLERDFPVWRSEQVSKVEQKQVRHRYYY